MMKNFEPSSSPKGRDPEAVYSLATVRGLQQGSGFGFDTMLNVSPEKDMVSSGALSNPLAMAPLAQH